MNEQKRLADLLPPEFLEGKFENCPAMRHAFVDVVETHAGPDAPPWPGTQKYVSSWYVLANGKAVGFNDNPSRGWSFPVINYQEPTREREPTLEITLRFSSRLHQKLHRVLDEHGFGFTVAADRLVGFEYRHEAKSIGVLLTPVDDEMEYGCLKSDGREVYSESDYSRIEWSWISAPHLSVEEALLRELHVLVYVRPALMYQTPW